jgi:hypothetical protein
MRRCHVALGASSNPKIQVKISFRREVLHPLKEFRYFLIVFEWEESSSF